ncbi:methyltransferase domain-containing protein [Marinilongibacter aquaticus]|nr:methyltransferase domain-containing protein [Marinilongibacter aquaticus]
MEDKPKNKPQILEKIINKTEELGFNMPSDVWVGSMLKALVSAKRGGQFLELGTGTGLSLAWILEGIDAESEVISIDYDPQLIDLVKGFFHDESRVKLMAQDGGEWILANQDKRFDLIFADAWPGKYSLLDETLALLKPGGIYLIDDMNPQANWPEGHAEKAVNLLAHLEDRRDLEIVKMNWSTGLVLGVKKD